MSTVWELIEDVSNQIDLLSEMIEKHADIVVIMLTTQHGYEFIDAEQLARTPDVILGLGIQDDDFTVVVKSLQNLYALHQEAMEDYAGLCGLIKKS